MTDTRERTVATHNKPAPAIGNPSITATRARNPLDTTNGTVEETAAMLPMDD
jgi:hypothetical protein